MVSDMEFYEANPSKIGPGHMNNFSCKMPGGLYRNSDADPFLDITHLELNKRSVTPSKNRSVEYCNKSIDHYVAIHSKKYLNSTYREFYQIIDDTIKEIGLNVQIIKTLSQKTNDQNLSLEKRVLIRTELEEYLIPLYIKLREKGFTHMDLWQ